MRCNLDAVIKKVGVNKLSKEIEATFALHRNLPDCRKINTRYTAATSEGANPNYVSSRKPKNRFECMRKGCVNTGTLMLSASTETVTFKAQHDATDYAAGAVSFYVYPATGATYPITVTFKIGEEVGMTNADVYTKSLTADMVTDDGFIPVVIDLAAAPTSEEGNGWTSGAVSYIQLSADKVVGFSSIAIYDSIDVFETNDVVKIGCLTEIGGSFDVNAIATTCLAAGYDDNVDSFTYNVTGVTATPNYWKLNPMMGKGTETEGFEIVTFKKTVQQGTGYGVISLSDLYQDECGYVSVMKNDDCDITDAFLSQLTIPTLMAIDGEHYQVIKNNDGTTTLYFNSDLVGEELLVSYPRTVEIEEEIATAENIGETRVRMTVPQETSDGARYLLVFDNVLITSFPATINNSSETSFNFTITIQRDDEGVFFRKRRIVA